MQEKEQLSLLGRTPGYAKDARDGGLPWIGPFACITPRLKSNLSEDM